MCMWWKSVRYSWNPSINTIITITVCLQDESDDSDNELDPVLKKWLEEKNKEFEDVLHVPLIVAGEDPPKSKRRVTRTRKTKT